MKEIIDIIHKSIYPFFDVCKEGEEPLSDKDKLLLKVNKAICNNLKALEKESCEDAVSRKAVKDWFCTNYCSEHNQCDHFEQGDCNAMVELFAIPSVNPQEPKWIPITTRPMTEEETEHYFEYSDMRIDDTYTILDCPLPDDGQEVLISINGYVETDVFIKDSDGCYFEGRDIDDVDAWMPLPQSYKKVRTMHERKKES